MSGGSGGSGGVSESSGNGGSETGGGGGAGGADGSGAGAGKSSGGATGVGGGSATCVEIQFELPSFHSEIDQSAAIYDYGLPPIGGPLGDTAAVQFYLTNGANGRAAGTFDLGAGADVNYKTCSRCVVVFQDDNGTDPVGALFFQASGTLTAADSGHAIGMPHVVLTDVTLVEVIVDAQFVSTPVPGGRCLHLATATL